MITNFKIFEKTSVIDIGVPYSVMKELQINYSISNDAKWKPLRYKKDLLTILHKPKNNLVISICKMNLFVIFSYNKEYYIETYTLFSNDDFGDEQWQNSGREISNITDILKKVPRGCKSYHLIYGNWTHDLSKKRKLKKEISDFEDITNNFKKNIIKKLTKIKKINVISKIDEYLINFENDYSEKYKEYLNIPIMIKKYGLDKINTAFMYYLSTNKLINL